MLFQRSVALALASALLLSVTACKRADVPACSDPQVEHTLEDLVTRGFPPADLTADWTVVASTVHSGLGGDIGTNSVLTAHVAVDVSGMRSSFRFSFDNARQRTNGPAENVRECTVDIGFSTMRPLSDFVHVAREGVYYANADLRGMAAAMQANAADPTM